MTDFETVRQQHMHYAMELLPGLAAAWQLPAERIAAEREARLRSLVALAVERSPWHRKRLAGVDLQLPYDELLAALPVMTKDDMMANFDDIVTEPSITLAAVEANLAAQPDAGYLPGGCVAISSGGSSGRRGVFVYSWTAFAALYSGLFRSVLRPAGAGPTAAVVAAGSVTHASARLARVFGGPHMPTTPLPVTLPTPQLVAGLNACDPELLVGYPSALHLLSAEARAGRLRISPRAVLCYAEPLLPEARAAIEAVWGVPVRNTWACSEGGAVGIACERGRTHLAEDVAIVEPVDAAGRPTPPGTRAAKVYVTSLVNEAMPLIRIEVTDEVTVRAEPCECGSAFPCLEDVQGRTDDTFRYGAVAVHPMAFRTPLGHCAQITEYQVRQSSHGAEIDLRCTGPVDCSELSREIAENLRALGVADPLVRVRVVDAIERGTMGKLKRFVALPVRAGAA